MMTAATSFGFDSIDTWPTKVRRFVYDHRV
jgi:hypothetical protein